MPTYSIRTKVLPGGRIEYQSPELPEGVEVVVDITVEGPKRSLDEILAEFPKRRRSFKDAAEVDRYINEERDSWDK